MPAKVSFAQQDAIRECEALAREDYAIILKGEGKDPEVELAGIQHLSTFQAFPSSYIKLLQVEHFRPGRRYMWTCYYLLIEQWDRRYRIIDLQVEPYL